MSRAREELAARRELLVARSGLHRLRLAQQSQALRAAIFTPRTALSLAAVPAARPLIFSALLVLLGRGRLAKWVRGAMAALAIGKALRAGLARGADRAP